MEIKEVGTFHVIENGYIQNPCVYPVLQLEYRKVVSDILEFYQEIFGDIIHSVYLRGSVAKGTAIPFFSDIDTIALVSKPVTEERKNKRYEVSSLICAKHDFIAGVEMHFEDIPHLEEHRLQFMLKTQCICIFGTDVIPSLREFKPCKDAYAHIFKIIEDIKNTELELGADIGSNETREICGWIMRRIVRTGFELVMERDQSYSRDLYPNYQRFILYYPQMAQQMRKALELAINPTDDPGNIIECMNSLKLFLTNEVEKCLSG
jgi:Nucleotidyltransferase domain